MLEKRVLVAGDPVKELAGLVQAGPFLFVGGCDGHRDLRNNEIVPALAADVENQCENAYGRLRALLRTVRSSTSAVVRLDHYTSSQDWLPRRQIIRSQFFGKPALLSSTGVAAKLSGINMLTAQAIAVADPADKEVLVAGADFGMGNISSAVRAGPLLFISGIRGNHDPRNGAAIVEETAQSFGEQTRVAYEIIGTILSRCGLGPEALLRLDCYIRDPNRIAEDAAIRREVFGPLSCGGTTVALPLSARGETEITALAVAPGTTKETLAEAAVGLPCVTGAGGFLFVDACDGNPRDAAGKQDIALFGDRPGQLEKALSILASQLQSCGSSLARTVRLEVFLRDIYFAPAAYEILARHFGADLPAVAITGAELESLLEVKLNAIAV